MLFVLQSYQDHAVISAAWMKTQLTARCWTWSDITFCKQLLWWKAAVALLQEQFFRPEAGRSGRSHDGRKVDVKIWNPIASIPDNSVFQNILLSRYVALHVNQSAGMLRLRLQR